MFAAGVVKAVYVFEEGDLDLAAGLPVPSLEQFRLERLEEAFDGGIVVAVALSAHRNLEVVVAQKLLIVMRTILRSAIRVVDTAWRRSAQGDCHVQGPECQILFYAVTDGPADHTPQKQIKDNS